MRMNRDLHYRYVVVDSLRSQMSNETNRVVVQTHTDTDRVLRSECHGISNLQYKPYQVNALSDYKCIFCAIHP